MVQRLLLVTEPLLMMIELHFQVLVLMKLKLILKDLSTHLTNLQVKEHQHRKLESVSLHTLIDLVVYQTEALEFAQQRNLLIRKHSYSI